ncbi:MAG TPA: hypothetical protein VL981_05230 [Candidatus Methylacidiphilales bacterium]|nr:hypothetical protein [Candidatus Methylacidiphilales bacterium]
MTGRIIRRRGDHYTSIDFDETSAAQIRELGRKAYDFLSVQDENHWQKAGAQGVLSHLIEGTVVLHRLGHRSGRPLQLDDDGAHLAFMACCAMALVTHNLDSKLVSVLGEVVEVLAICCPVELTLRSLPPIRTLPKVMRTTREVQRQYQFWQRAKNVPKDIPLCDALTLLQIFQESRRPEDVQMKNKLIEITEGFRTARRRIHETCTS